MTEQEHENNYTISRGMISINGRYVGNTPKMKFYFKNGSYRIAFITQDISMENIELFFGKEKTVEIEYLPENPSGKQIGFKVSAKLSPDDFAFKGDDWQGIAFEAKINHPPEWIERK